MCGIIGYIGDKPCIKTIIDGLYRLEYRGYDSAGIAIIDSGKLKLKKIGGRIGKLVHAVDSDKDFGFSDFKSTDKENDSNTYIGIGHTRWATHGEPNEINAHPHTDCKGEFAIVHNGIIENYPAIKNSLIEMGHRFKSDTDSEVIAHLIEEFYEGDLKKAVDNILPLLEGSYGIAVITSKEPDKIVAVRRGSPLKIGIGTSAFYLASDIPAILPHTSSIIELDDDEIATLEKIGNKLNYSISHVEKGEVNKKISKILMDVRAVEKDGFSHFMLKEIYEQPDAVGNTLYGKLKNSGGRLARLSESIESGDMKEGLGNLKNIGLKYLLDVDKIYIVACGTSMHAGYIAEYLIEDLARIPVEVETASEFLYKNPIIDKNTLVIVISQSGETADTIASMRKAQARGSMVFGICNVPGSTIASETDGGKFTHAGIEIGVASTKAFTAQMAVIYLIAVYLGAMKNLPARASIEILDQLREIPDKMKKALKKCEKEAIKISDEFYNVDNFLYIGRNLSYPIAMEGALKLKEISYIHAEGYAAGEMKHGPIALIDKNMITVVIAPKDCVYDKTMSNISEIKARKGKIIAIATEGDKRIGEIADHVIYVPKTHALLTPFLTVVPLQLLAYHIASKRGCDIDKPRNLAKSVTVE